MRSRAVSLPALVLALDRRVAPGVQRLLAQLGELVEALLDRVRRSRPASSRTFVAVQCLGFGGALQVVALRHAAIGVARLPVPRDSAASRAAGKRSGSRCGPRRGWIGRRSDA